MRKTLLHVLASCLIPIGYSGSAAGQGNPNKEASIVDVHATKVISIEIDIRAGEKRLVIPNCKEDREEPPAPCVAHLQRFNGKEWYAARIVPGLAMTLGVEGKEKWKPVVIAPGRTVNFWYGTETDIFGIQKGEQLRIVVEAWDSVESMKKNDKPDSIITSPAFPCP
jgi:hypothetical protein